MWVVRCSAIPTGWVGGQHLNLFVCLMLGLLASSRALQRLHWLAGFAFALCWVPASLELCFCRGVAGAAAVGSCADGQAKTTFVIVSRQMPPQNSVGPARNFPPLRATPSIAFLPKDIVRGALPLSPLKIRHRIAEYRLTEELLAKMLAKDRASHKPEPAP